MATRKYKFKHIAASASTHVGDGGELILDTSTNTLKVSDGSTPIRPRNPNGTRARMMDAIRLLFVCVFIFRSVFADGDHYRAF